MLCSDAVVVTPRRDNIQNVLRMQIPGCVPFLLLFLPASVSSLEKHQTHNALAGTCLISNKLDTVAFVIFWKRQTVRIEVSRPYRYALSMSKINGLPLAKLVIPKGNGKSNVHQSSSTPFCRIRKKHPLGRLLLLFIVSFWRQSIHISMNIITPLITLPIGSLLLPKAPGKVILLVSA
jgi:hypothetical protein